MKRIVRIKNNILSENKINDKNNKKPIYKSFTIKSRDDFFNQIISDNKIFTPKQKTDNQEQNVDNYDDLFKKHVTGNLIIIALSQFFPSMKIDNHSDIEEIVTPIFTSDDSDI